MSNTNLKTYLDGYSVEMIEAMKRVLIEKDKGDTDFINSLNYKVREEIESIDVEFIMQDYAKWVDEGRAAGKMPPLDVITKWVQKKGLPESAIFPIRQNIGKFGIPPTNFKQPLVDSKTSLFSGIEKSSAKDIASDIKNID